MTNAATITKIEQVTEAIESLVVASITLHQNPNYKNHKGVADARQEVAAALTDFLAPTLRVVVNEKIDIVGDVSSTVRRTVSEPFLQPVRDEASGTVEHIPAPDARPAYPVA